MRSKPRARTLVVAAMIGSFAATPGRAQTNGADSSLTGEGFRRPSPDIVEAVLAPWHLNVTLGNPSPDGRLLLTERSAGPPSMASFAAPFYRLGGLQIDPRANRDRRLSTRSAAGIEVTDRETGQVTSIDVPDGARVSSATWSPDGARIAFLAHFEDATHVYVADPTDGRARRVTRSPVLATLSQSITWTPDARSIVTVLVPENRAGPPAPPRVPTGPQVRFTTPETNRIRTYPDLLETQHERALLAYYTTGQLVLVDVERRRVRSVGTPAMIRSVDLSPDGRYARVSTMRKPFSYVVPVRQFGGAEEVWSLEDGSVLALLTERAVRDGSPTDTATDNADAPNRRAFAWRPDGQGLSFLQMVPRQRRDSAAADSAEPSSGGEQGQRERRRDRVFQWQAPFDTASMAVIYESTSRLSRVRYSPDAQMLFLTEQQGETGHDYAVFLSDPKTKHTIWRGRRSGSRFGRRGPQVLTKNLPNGVSVLRTTTDGEHVFLSGTDYADDPAVESPKAYVDRVHVETGEKQRVYESENDGVHERLLEVLDDDASLMVVSRERPTEVPNSYLRNVATGELRQLTHNTDYTPDITQAQRRRYAVTRVDGLEFAVDVTLPATWTGERLPGMIWFYPREYTDQDSYDETRQRWNKNAFPTLRARSMDILVRLGYAVIEPDAPIIGDRGRMNDNYVHDLRNNLAATIDFLDKEGIIDRERLGVGGHSYGAFSTVNAMVHTPFFKAGIAGDGNFNRTLTPFSFQSERRSLWQARDLYFSVSPLFYANNLSGALLLYHGEHDQNVGTFPINSWRLFESLEALGKTAALYVYPFEDHGPATEETLLDLWARWTAWLDKYVKNAGSESQRVAADEAVSGGH
jgi:dipeptidyl aminopeptidase/acylaminoacyl peptidase